MLASARHRRRGQELQRTVAHGGAHHPGAMGGGSVPPGMYRGVGAALHCETDGGGCLPISGLIACLLCILRTGSGIARGNLGFCLVADGGGCGGLSDRQTPPQILGSSCPAYRDILAGFRSRSGCGPDPAYVDHRQAMDPLPSIGSMGLSDGPNRQPATGRWPAEGDVP